jgi:hypothetical protein
MADPWLLDENQWLGFKKKKKKKKKSLGNF